MATVAVSTILELVWRANGELTVPQNPTLYQTYLHITSTSKNGLEKAVKRAEELMKQELPNLVDERRFRQKEPEQVERDEFRPPPSRRRRLNSQNTASSFNQPSSTPAQTLSPPRPVFKFKAPR